MSVIYPKSERSIWFPGIHSRCRFSSYSFIDYSPFTLDRIFFSLHGLKLSLGIRLCCEELFWISHLRNNGPFMDCRSTIFKAEKTRFWKSVFLHLVQSRDMGFGHSLRWKPVNIGYTNLASVARLVHWFWHIVSVKPCLLGGGKQLLVRSNATLSVTPKYACFHARSWS